MSASAGAVMKQWCGDGDDADDGNGDDGHGDGHDYGHGHGHCMVCCGGVVIRSKDKEMVMGVTWRSR